MKRILALFTFVILGGLLMACSSDKNIFSPEQVLSHALENSEKITSYVAESVYTAWENDKVIEEGKLKEWRDGEGRVRMETYDASGELLSIVVNNGQELIIYDLENEQASVIDDPELIQLNQQTPKEQAEASLAIVKDSHDLTLKDETKIAGRDVKHIVATPKEKSTFLGKQEMWIDKENWLVLKTVSESGDHRAQIEYEKIDFDAKVSDDQFTLDIPGHVKVIELDDIYSPDNVSLSEATAALEQPFLHFPESDELVISTVEKTELDGIVNRTEIDIEYEKDDLPFLSLSIFETPEDAEDIMFSGDEETTIRGEKAIYTDMEGFRAVSWDEKGLRYSIIMIDPDVTIENIKELVEDMTYTEERDD